MNSPSKARVCEATYFQSHVWRALILGFVSICSSSPSALWGQDASYEFAGDSTAGDTYTAVTSAPSGGAFSSFARTGLVAESASGEFRSSGWNQGASIDLLQYLEFSLTPSAGNVSFLKSLAYDVSRSSKGPANIEVRLFGATSPVSLGIQAVPLGNGNGSSGIFDFKDTITADTLAFRFYGKDANSKNTDGTLSLGNISTRSASPDFGVASAATNLTGNTALYAESNPLNLSGNIGGAFGIDKIGSHVATLSGTNTYTGGTSVSAGTLRVGSGGVGSIISAVTVSSGATLAGSGTINGDVTADSGARYAPGDSGIGTQTINGNLALAGGSLFAWELAPPSGSSSSANQGSYDKVVLSGALSGTSVFNIGLLGANNSFDGPFWGASKTWSDVLTPGSGSLQSVFTAFGGSDVGIDGTVAGVGKFSFSENTLSFTSFSTVPEPTSALAGLLLAAGLLRRARR